MARSFRLLLYVAVHVLGLALWQARGGAEPLEAAALGSLARSPAEGESVIINTLASGETRVALQAPEPDKSGLMPLPLFTDLMGYAVPQSFGKDGRCAVSDDAGQVRLDCAPGTSISGATLVFKGFRLPAGAALSAMLTSSATDGFMAQVAAAGADAEAPQPVGHPATRFHLPLLAADIPPQLVILAPERGGILRIERLELMPEPSARETSLSAWAWSPDLWRVDPANLIAAARRNGLTRLFVTLDIERGKLVGASELRRFIRLAGDAGIKIQAVEGDPRMSAGAGLANALSRARAFAAFQRTSSPREKLDGIQYDIEPYVLSGWGGTAEDYEGWARAVQHLVEAAGEPVDLVLPFWILGTARGEPFLDKLTGSISGVTVMSYRTQKPLLSQIAEPLLSWGSRHGKPVRLALEAGPLSDETEETFSEAQSGTIALMEDGRSLVRLENEGILPGARMYRLTRRTTIRGANLSFLGREEAMKTLAAETAGTFSAWPAFSGFAFHGLSWTLNSQ